MRSMTPFASTLLLFCAIGLALSAAGCGSDSMSGPDTPAGPDPVTTSPASAAPGSVVSIRGMTRQINPLALRARVGGQPAPAVLSESGQLLIAVPLEAAGPDGQSPPPDPLDVEILDGDERAGFGQGVLSVQVLPNAPGSAATLQRELEALTGDLVTVFDDLHPNPTEAEGYALSVLAAVETIVSGDGPESLRSLLETLPDAERDLLDGFLASSGVLAQTQELVASLSVLSRESSRSMSRTAMGGTIVTDQELARKMQFQVIARLFGQTVINETAETYATTVGLATGAAGLVATVPGAAVVSAILAVIDFAVNKILLGLMPESITDFELILEDDTLLLGETTAAKVGIRAVNAPPLVGIQDFVGLTLNLLGLGNTPEAQAFKDVLLDTAAFFLGTIQGGLASYANEHPELGLDVSFSIIPVMQWDAVIHDPRLVDCVSLTPNLVAGLDEDVNWIAAPDQVGKGKIYARIATGAESILLNLPPGFEYTGGAFGEEVKSTATKTVLVGGELVVEVDFASTIAVDGFNALEVRAGYEDAEGEPVWSQGLQVDLVIDGGEAEETSGQTDEDGQFITLVQLLPESEDVIITVTVSDELGQSEDETVSATATGEVSVVILEGGFLITEADFHCGVGEYGPGWAPENIQDHQRNVVNVDASGSYQSASSVGGNLSHPNGDTASANAMATASLEVQTNPNSSTLAVISATAEYSGSASANRNKGANGASGEADIGRVVVRFEVVGGPVQYDLTSSFNGTPQSVNFLDEFYHVQSDGEIGSPQISGELDEGVYAVYISNAICVASSLTNGSCSEGFELELILTK